MRLIHERAGSSLGVYSVFFIEVAFSLYLLNSSKSNVLIIAKQTIESALHQTIKSISEFMLFPYSLVLIATVSTTAPLGVIAIDFASKGKGFIGPDTKSDQQ